MRYPGSVSECWPTAFLLQAGQLGRGKQLVNKARDTKNHMKGWAHRAMLRQMRAANKCAPVLP